MAKALLAECQQLLSQLLLDSRVPEGGTRDDSTASVPPLKQHRSSLSSPAAELSAQLSANLKTLQQVFSEQEKRL